MKLSELQNGQQATITSVSGNGAFRKRIIEMGFIKGKTITAIKNAPLKDPIEYKIMDYYVSLRRSEAEMIDITQEDDAIVVNDSAINNVREIAFAESSNTLKTIKIALVGNPNCGKTTLFNHASGSKERTGNYSGVTVGAKTAHFTHNGYLFEVSDLPGTYSISTYSPEEVFVRDHIIHSKPDIVVNILDATNLERNLYLTTQLLDMGVKMVAALNMYDELHKAGSTLNHVHLGRMLGVPMIPTVSTRGKGITQLLEKIIDVYEGKDPIVRRIEINYGPIAEKTIDKLEEALAQSGFKSNGVTSRYMAIKALEKDYDFIERQSQGGRDNIIVEELEAIAAKGELKLKEDFETFITDLRYGYIAGALRETLRNNSKEKTHKSQLIDNILTHKIWGIPIFLFFMWIMFEATFNLGEVFMNWIEDGVALFGQFMHTLMPDGVLKDLLIDGVINGVGGVIVFLPNILILFFFISLMEDTGYMARAAFIMDKLMHKMGLHGKSFIPLIMGFGCNVPAIMATRTIEDKNNRLITILINPFMSCSARLPVYILILSAFFPEHAGTMLFGIYITGIVVAVLIARLFKKVIFKGKELPFVMELPPYRIPTIRNTVRQMWNRASQYLSKVGGTILVASIIIWFLSNFPVQQDLIDQYDEKIAQTEASYDMLIGEASTQEDVEKLTEEKLTISDNLEHEKNSLHQAGSYIGGLGQLVEPIMKPLGFDWKMSVSLITGIAAKEIVISTLAVLYQADEDESGNQKLIDRLRSDVKPNGEPAFTQSSALAFIIFTLLYFPCVAVIATIKREAGSWKWALLTIGYTSILAWGMAFLVSQASLLL